MISNTPTIASTTAKSTRVNAACHPVKFFPDGSMRIHWQHNSNFHARKLDSSPDAALFAATGCLPPPPAYFER